MLLLNALGGSPNTIELLLKEINSIRNPVFLSSPDEKVDGRFRETAELLASLHRRGFLTWSEQPGEKPAFVLFLRGSGPAYVKEVTRLHELLGLGKPRSLEEALTLRILNAVGTPEGSVLQIVSRSVYDLFLVAAAAVDVPAGHVESGLAPKLPPCGPAVAHFRVRRSQGPPSNAMVAIKYHGWWYSIAATDGHSKATFRLIEAVMTSRIAETVDPGAAKPVLTVPVSR